MKSYKRKEHYHKFYILSGARDIVKRKISRKKDKEILNKRTKREIDGITLSFQNKI